MESLPELIGESPLIREIKERIGRLLRRQTSGGRFPPVLIEGETGTGKGLLARAMHRAGSRAEGRFVDVNCAAIPETLLEAELFGFERGAFTDARQSKPGLFQTAHRGTIFLDEVGLLPEALQAKLLTVIEERTVRRLGSTRAEPADAWVITATNTDLRKATQERRFREDLYHRLAVVTVTLPPLRQRAGDTLLLASHFLARACADYGLAAKTLAPDARAALLAYPWPGNVRELANVMERVALLADSTVVTAGLLGLSALETPAAGVPESAGSPDAESLADAVGAVEREHLLAALRDTAWNVTRAAARLGISRDTLRYRIAKHALRPNPTAARRARAPAPPAARENRPVTGQASALAPVRWERRRLTILRAALAPQPTGDPRLYPSRALEAIVEKVQGFGGRVEERSPTGLVAVFGVEPVEDAPRRAARAAMAIQKAADRARADETDVVPIQIAIHVGQFLVGQAGAAAQIDLEGKREAWTLLDALAAAPPDAVVVSETARPFLDREFELEPLAAPVAAACRGYRLLTGQWSGLRAGRRMATFVGRGHELDLLHGRLVAAMQGQGQAVGILGEAGIGKSRLVFEFRRALLELRVTYLEGRCQSYGTAIPYLPILDILRQNLRIAEVDGPDVIAQRIRAGLQELEMDPGQWAPYLLHLFGVKEGTESLAALSPAAVKARTFEVLRQMGLRGARRRPHVFVVEDLQWIDTTSEECLAALIESMVGARALLLATYRPGYRPPWVDKSYATQVALQPLSREQGRSVLLSLHDTPVPDPVARVILDRAEGNPFFIEELSRAVVETGDPSPPHPVPETIEEVLRARVDRLPAEPKRLLETAAVLGRQAPLSLLRAVWRGEGDLDPHLRELTRLEFLYPAGGGTEPEYGFVHPLTQEVVYASMEAPWRQALHTAAAQALEQLHADRLEEVYDRLAHHYSRAAAADKAVAYLARLAERAAGAHAHTEAVRLLSEALGHVDGLPAPDRDRRRLDLLLRQAYALVPLGRFREVVDLLGRHRDALERVADASLSGHYHFLLGRSQMFLGDSAGAAESARLGIAEATRCGDDLTLGKIHYFLAQASALSGRMREGTEHGRRAVALLEASGEQWWIGPAYWAVGFNHALLGEFDRALEAEARATAIAAAIGDPELQSCAAWATGVIQAVMGDHPAGVETCRRALELAPDPLNSAIAAGWLGFARLEAGDAAGAIPPLEQSRDRLDAFRFTQLHAWFTAIEADALAAVGRCAEARELAARVLEPRENIATPCASGYAHRALGRLEARHGTLARAETCLVTAVRLFDDIDGRYDAARTRVDLAAVRHAAGEHDAAARELEAAARAFAGMAVPAHVERIRRLAVELGIPFGR